MLTELEVFFFSIVDYKLERISSFGALSSRCENSLGLPFPYVHYGVKKRVISFFFFLSVNMMKGFRRRRFCSSYLPALLSV